MSALCASAAARAVFRQDLDHAKSLIRKAFGLEDILVVRGNMVCFRDHADFTKRFNDTKLRFAWEHMERRLASCRAEKEKAEERIHAFIEESSLKTSEQFRTHTRDLSDKMVDTTLKVK